MGFVVVDRYHSLAHSHPSALREGDRKGGLTFSEIERQLVEVNIVRNVADLAAVDGDLIGEHARGGDLNGIRPVVVVVAKRICEIEDGLLGNER